MSGFDESMIRRMVAMEREIERLRVKESLNKSLADTYYLGVSSKAVDADKLDGIDSSQFQPLLDSQTSIELGLLRGSNGASFIDFHTVNDQKDFDTRILATDGNASNGQGNMTYYGAIHNFTGLVRIGGYNVGQWASYTPIWTASTTNPTLGNGSLTGRYCVVGKLCTMSVKLNIGSTTTLGAGNWAFLIPLPVIAGDANAPVYIGTAHCRNLGAMSYVLAVYLEPNISTTKTAYFVQDNTNSINLTPTVPFAWATGDLLMFEITYELA